MLRMTVLFVLVALLVTGLLRGHAFRLLRRRGQHVLRVAETKGPTARRTDAEERTLVPAGYVRVKPHRYDVAISLGEMCQPAAQLKTHGYREMSLPFDSLGTPFEALCHLFEHDFHGFLEKDDLRAVISHDAEGDEIVRIDTDIGLMFIHDFAQDDSWILDFEHVKQRYDRRIARLYRLLTSGIGVVFIRTGMTRDQAIRLRDLLQRKFPHLDFLLVAVNFGNGVAEDWMLKDVRHFTIPASEEWFGDTDAYGRLLESLPLARGMGVLSHLASVDSSKASIADNQAIT